ncbi:Uncharacterised protein [Mycobacteroides abscessus subsp. abscessus]|nr:Uncharacterised protein [Mycobacteroides abscessus subsp. abscessus]
MTRSACQTRDVDPRGVAAAASANLVPHRTASRTRYPHALSLSIHGWLEFRASHESPRPQSTRGSNSASPTNRRALDQREARIPSRGRRGFPAARGSTLGFPAARVSTAALPPEQHAALVRAFDPRLAGIPRLPRTAARSINARLEFRVAGDADFQLRVDRRRGSATRAVAPRPSRAPGATSTLSPAGRGGRSTARGRGRRR